MTIKKQYVDIVAFLQANENKKVATILEELKSMCESKVQLSTVIYDTEGSVEQIFCYYHKVWENISKHEYGNKKSSTTGLNTMCKDGVRRWTKTQAEYKKLDGAILELIGDGKLEVSEMAEYKEAKKLEIAEIVKTA